MPDRLYNRRAFGNISGPPLGLLYTRLIALELALKDRHGRAAANFGKGHNIFLAIQTGAYPAPVQTASTALDRALGCLIVDNGALVASNYPALRYLQHQDDCGAAGSPEVHVEDALRLANALIDLIDQHFTAQTPPLPTVIP
jgi:hypothetical protein